MSDPEIVDVRAIGVRAPLEEPFGYSQAWVTDRTSTLVRIETRDGTVGWGECWGPSAGTRETVDEFLGPLLVGEDPTDPAARHAMLYDRSRAAYQSVVPFPALSGVDIALWDLAGTLKDEPVCELLGERRRESAPAYATGHYFRHDRPLDEQYAAIAAEAEENAAHLGAVKIKLGLQLLGYGPSEDLELVERVRAAIGPDASLMVDANYAYDRETALTVGRRLQSHDVEWFEEPVAPEDADGYRSLRADLAVPVAGGECHSEYELTRLVETSGLDVAQPDVCNTGGLTSGREVVRTAAENGVRTVPHMWGTPVAVAATLHLVATIPGPTYLEYDRSPNPLRDDLATEAVDAGVDGRVPIPGGPGLGVDIDAGALDRYRTDP